MKEPDPKPIDLTKLSPGLRAICEGIRAGTLSEAQAVALVLAMPQDPRDDKAILSFLTPEARKVLDDAFPP